MIDTDHHTASLTLFTHITPPGFIPYPQRKVIINILFVTSIKFAVVFFLNTTWYLLFRRAVAEGMDEWGGAFY